MKANRSRKNRAEWLIPAGLILLSVVPVVGGAARIVELGSGVEITPDNARLFASPLPMVLHIISVTLYAVSGAFQFAPGLRRRSPGGHRTVGRFLIPCGLVAAFTGLWMTLFYPWPEGDGELLYLLRLLFGSAMLASILLGVTAVRRRDYNRAWRMDDSRLRHRSGRRHAGTDPLALVPLLRRA